MKTAVAAAAWAAAVAGYVYTLVVRLRLDGSGRPELSVDVSEAVVYGAALVSVASVGFIVAIRRPRHPVGWLFLALGVALAVGAAGDAYALDRGVGDGDLGSTAAGLALVAGQASFIAWFALVAAVLQLTPTGRPLSRRWGRLLAATVAAAVIALFAKLIQDTPFEPPYASMTNPWAAIPLAAVVDAVAAVTISLTALGLIVAGVSLVLRFRRAAPSERRQLKWLVIIAVALPVLVGASFVSNWIDLDVVRTVATGGFVALLPIATGLSVQQYRLYDIDRILSRATAYVLSTLAIGGVYLVAVTLAGAVVGSFLDGSALPVVAATVAAVTAARPLHARVQDVVDRRFDRRRHDARRIVADHLGAAVPGRSIEATLAAALGDPALRVGYWVASKKQWVTADGQAMIAAPDDIDIARDGEPVARLRIDDESTDLRLARELADASVKELDNVRLRAELALQLEEIRDSRARIVAAQSSERRRIERNLHDGAQQRLLALAMQLRGAQLHSTLDPSDSDLLDRAIDQIGESVRELRDLANGLHPAALHDGGLGSALDQLAGRVPLKVTLDLCPMRLPSAVEEALWFVACEAVANAVKHARAESLALSLTTEPDVRFVCSDDGNGRADPSGSGLRGIADRVEAIGGRLVVVSTPGSGTIVEAVIPCAS